MQHTAVASQLIYVVDDDAAISRLVAINLTARGYRVKQFSRGLEVLASLQVEQPDLIILDLIMPEVDGFEVARAVRRSSLVPILVLSVRDETSAKLAALEIGADDYLTKPFRVEELLARIRAILRRSSPANVGASLSHTDYRVGGLQVDLEGMRVVSHGNQVQLTPREWAALRVLVKNAGKIVSSKQLLEEAWGADYTEEGEYVRAYITRLRRKLEPKPRSPRYILLERGLGYRLVNAEQGPGPQV